MARRFSLTVAIAAAAVLGLTAVGTAATPAAAGDTGAVIGWSSQGLAAAYRCAYTGDWGGAERFARNSGVVSGLAQAETNYRNTMTGVRQWERTVQYQNYASQMRLYAWQSYQEARQAAAIGDYGTARQKVSEFEYYARQAEAYR